MMLEKIFRTRFNLVDVVAISVANALWFNDKPGLSIVLFVVGTLASFIGGELMSTRNAKK